MSMLNILPTGEFDYVIKGKNIIVKTPQGDIVIPKSELPGLFPEKPKNKKGRHAAKTA